MVKGVTETTCKARRDAIEAKLDEVRNDISEIRNNHLEHLKQDMKEGHDCLLGKIRDVRKDVKSLDKKLWLIILFGAILAAAYLGPKVFEYILKIAV